MKKKKILLLVGVPCSGKSTFAKQFATEHKDYFIINRDSIRTLICNGGYDMSHEDLVTDIEHSMSENHLMNGHNIIVDSTNLNPKYLKYWYELAILYNADIEKKEFKISYAEAMARSEKRKDEGGLYIDKKTMQSFFKRYYKDDFENEIRDKRLDNYIPYDERKKDCIIIDLDGTIALHQGRTPFEWERLIEDIPDGRLQKLLEKIMSQGNVDLIVITGRPDDEYVKANTITWLNSNKIPYTELYMRDNKDFRSGDIVKKELYEKNVKDKYNVLAVFEDSNKCVKMWRNEGLLTCQVENGDY